MPTAPRARLAAGALVLALTVAVALLAALPAASETTLTRLDAATPVEAGIAVSQEAFADGAASHAVLVRDDLFADALVAGPLAGELPDLAPILFTGGDRLDDAVAAELERVTAETATVHIIGGEAALSTQVADDAADLGLAVQRVGGATRLDTSELVFRTFFAGDALSGDVLAARAYGTGPDERDAWPDSITAGGYGAAAGVPIVLVGREGPTPELASALVTAFRPDETSTARAPEEDAPEGEDDDAPSDDGSEDESSTVLGTARVPGAETATVIVVGGTDAVPASAEQDLADLGFDTLRASGSTREETAVQVARELYGIQALTAGDTAVLVNGRDSFAFGLAASTLAAVGSEAGLDAPILLVSADEPRACGTETTEGATACYLSQDGTEPGPVVIVGDLSQVGETVAETARAARG